MPPPPWIRQWICRDDAGRFFHKRNCFGVIASPRVAAGSMFSERSSFHIGSAVPRRKRWDMPCLMELACFFFFSKRALESQSNKWILDGNVIPGVSKKSDEFILQLVDRKQNPGKWNAHEGNRNFIAIFITPNSFSCNHEIVVSRRKNKTCAILLLCKFGHFDTTGIPYF